MVVCYLLENVKKHTQDVRLQTVMTAQPTAYSESARIIFCHDLSMMFEEDLEHLKSFMTSLWRQKCITSCKERFPVVEKPSMVSICIEWGSISGE